MTAPSLPVAQELATLSSVEHAVVNLVGRASALQDVLLLVHLLGRAAALQVVLVVRT